MTRATSKTAQAAPQSDISAGKAVDFQALAENTIDVIIRCGMDGIANYVSPSVQQLLGMTPEELIGRSHRSLVLPEDLPALATTLASHRGGKSDGLATYRMRRKDGSLVWVESSGRAIRDPITGANDLVIVMRDISERKALEAKLSLLALTAGEPTPDHRRAADHGRDTGHSTAREARPKATRMVN